MIICNKGDDCGVDQCAEASVRDGSNMQWRADVNTWWCISASLDMALLYISKLYDQISRNYGEYKGQIKKVMYRYSSGEYGMV